jgi:hypothetical protein
MALLDFISKNRLDESIKAFERKGQSKISDEKILDRSGEGIADVFTYAQGFAKYGLHGFFDFYSSYLNRVYESEVAKINNYRIMAEYSEISDVIEDACNEAITTFDDGDYIKLVINDDKLSKNSNVVNNIYREFNELFSNRIDIDNKLWDLFRTYLIDGRVYYERIIKKSNPKAGIYNIKKLPTETMDYDYNPILNKIMGYYQYIGKNIRRPSSLKEAQNRKDIIVFEPEQIGYIDYGIYGKTRQEVMGYLEKCKVAYNQIKLLETAVIIYRLVRAPERFVFKIDTGRMPWDKAIKFVNKIKESFIKKKTYNPNTGEMGHEPEIMSMLENFYIPVNSEGRGSSIDTIGGNAKGFTELDDVYYFNKKLFRALKYPISRVSEMNEGKSPLFGANNANNISRDEIKWARFLERHQNKFTEELRNLFLLHLEFRGLKKEYKLTKNSFKIIMPSPSHYKDSMEQTFREQEFANYAQLSNNPEFSKSYLIKRYLNWTTEDLKENMKGFKLDKKYFPQQNQQNPLGGPPGMGDMENKMDNDDEDNIDIDNDDISNDDREENENTGPGRLIG